MLNKIQNFASFTYIQRVKGFDIPDAPHFEGEGSAYFPDRIRQSKFYLEYGCGGSTIEAVRLDKRVISVESDKFFLNAVRRKLQPINPKITLIHADIGMTYKWGTPIFLTKTSSRLRRWANYSASPWKLILPSDLPDLILVDGRFRVACALTSIKAMNGHDFELLFDDYEGRPHYKVVERFATLTKMVGRMAVFRPSSYDRSELQGALQMATQDFR